MRFFFYGTLLDRDVTALVLGRRLAPRDFLPAALPEHARRRAKGGSYPVVVPDPRGEVAGAVVSGLSAGDVAALAAYEGQGYRVASLKVRMRGRIDRVSVFEPVASRLQPSGDLWDLTLWQRRYKRAFIERLRRAFSGRPVSSRR